MVVACSVAAIGLSVDCLGQNDVSAQWLEGDQGMAVVRTDGVPGTSSVLVSNSFQTGFAALSFTSKGIRDVQRLDLGTNLAEYLAAGFDQGTGFVESVGVFWMQGQAFTSAPLTIWTGPDPIDAVFYAPALGELFLIDTTTASIHWAPYPSWPVSWSTISVPELSSLDPNLELFVGIDGDPSLPLPVIGLQPAGPYADGLEIEVAGSGQITISDVPAAFDPSGFILDENGVTTSQRVIDGIGVPGAIAEAYVSGPGTVIGTAVVGADGSVSIPIRGVQVGDEVGVRRLGERESHFSRHAYATNGFSESSAAGLTVHDIGGSLAELLVIGTSDFRVLFSGHAPHVAVNQPFAYPAVLSVGTPSDIVFDAVSGQSYLIGPGATMFSVVLGRYGSDVVGYQSIPIVNDTAVVGLQLSFQWGAFDAGQLVVSNIATVAILAN